MADRMRRLERLGRMVAAAAAVALLAVLPACGARTGLRVPDLRPFRAPLCSNDTASVRIATRPDAVVPTRLTIARVEYHVSRRCSYPSQSDPQQPGTGYHAINCIITVYAYGNVESGGDCVGPGLGPPPASWHVGRTGTDPRNLFVEMAGATQGNFCVVGTVWFTNGATAELPMRTWRVQLGAGRFIPEVGYWITRNNDTGQDPIVNPFPSAAGCIH